MFEQLLALLKTFGRNASSESDDAMSAVISKLEERIVKLEALLEGIQRITSPDGVPGLYIPFRVGIMSEYFLHQPRGQGRALVVTTDVDPVAVRIQHDGANYPENTQRVALEIQNTDPNPDGTNTGIHVVASNAPHGNTAVFALAQYSPNADEKLTIIKQLELL